MSHTLRMLIGCLIPLALIFALPLMGVSSGITLLMFIGLMFVCHLMMMGGHGHGGHAGHRSGKGRTEHGGVDHRPYEQHQHSGKEPSNEPVEIDRHRQH